MARSASIDKVAFWRRHIATQEQGALSQVAYCREQGISDKAYTYWKRRLRNGVGAPKPKLFVEFKNPRTARILFPNGAVLECDSGIDAAWLGAVIAGAPQA